MATQVILLERVEKLGDMGDLVNVKPGYARNYLLPQGLAVHASKAIERQLEARKAIVAEKYQAEIAAANEVAAKVAETSITVPMQVGEEDETAFVKVLEQNRPRRRPMLFIDGRYRHRVRVQLLGVAGGAEPGFELLVGVVVQVIPV